MEGDNDNNDKENTKVAAIDISPIVGITKELEMRMEMSSRGDI